MAKKSELKAEQRMQLVLRLLSKEEPAVQIARRAEISERTLYRWREQFLEGGKQGLEGAGADAAQAREMARLASRLAERDQVIGELTIANRILKNFRAAQAERGAASYGRSGTQSSALGAVVQAASALGLDSDSA